MAGDLGKKKMEILKELFDNLPTNVNTREEFKKYIEEHESYLIDIHVPGGIWEKDNVVEFLKENFLDEESSTDNNVIDEFKNMSELVNEHANGLVIDTDKFINDISNEFLLSKNSKKVLKEVLEERSTTSPAPDNTEDRKVNINPEIQIGLIENELLNNCSLDLVKDQLITFCIRNIGVELKIELGAKYTDLIKTLSLLNDDEVIKTVNNKLSSFSDDIMKEDEDIRKLLDGLSEEPIIMIMKRVILEDVISSKKQNNSLIVCNVGSVKLLKKSINDFLSNSKESDRLQLLNFFKVNDNLFNSSIQTLHGDALAWYATVRTKFNDTCISGLPAIFIVEYEKFKKKEVENKKLIVVSNPPKQQDIIDKKENGDKKIKDNGDVFVSDEYLRKLYKGARF